VIGAGASGLMAVIRLRAAGFDDVVAFEKASTLGGTWRDNRYPGVACDVPSLAYRYSFAPHADWSHAMAPGAEILAYLQETAARHDVERVVRYDSEVVGLDWSDGAWRLETTQGDQGRFDVVVTATGVLHHPVVPDIPGLADFAGPAFHTARWNMDTVLAGKRVGIIGTGSSSVQIAAAVVDDVAHLTLFQRTAQWILPVPNKPIPEERRRAFRADPALLESEYRRLTGRHNADFAAAVVGANPEAYAAIEAACADHLATVRDPELRRRLTPTYKVGCKRLVMSGTFYEAMQRSNAELVTEPIAAVVADGVRTADGCVHPLDVLVLATGFDTHRLVRPMRVTGPDGLTLDAAWAEQNHAYRTVAVPGFPNWFMLGGPNSPIGNFSWLQTAETQFDYVLHLIRRLAAGDVRAIAPTSAATRAFNDAIHAQLPNTIWASGCQSWYMDARGRIASWPWTFERFVDDLRTPQWTDFDMH
jgi:cation diffusion facilitator CzcD-associated flavoprotein CzcO